MGRPTNAERAARAANADNTMIEGNEILEEFEQPVAKVAPSAPVPAGMATVRVLPKGHGKVATGHYDRDLNAFTYHSRGEHLIVPLDVAKTQEDAGLVEIVSGG